VEAAGDVSCGGSGFCPCHSIYFTNPFAWYQSTDVLALKFVNFAPYDTIVGLLLYVGLGWYLVAGV
jgi:hypothetical protein